MSFQPIHLLGISYLGTNKASAILEFQSGLNVIWGASNTGKSFVIETIEFILGSSKKPKDIKESIGYEKIRLLLEDSNNNLHTIERSMQGGNFLLFRESALKNEPEQDGEKLSKTSSKDNSLSSFLLDLLGLPNKKVRKSINKFETQNLTFRPLSKFSTIPEELIIRNDSPVNASKINSNVTYDASVFKLLLTGVDDSSLIDIQNIIIQGESELKKSQSKLEVLEEFIQESRADTRAQDLNRQELETTLKSLQTMLSEYQQSLTDTENTWRQLINQRNKILQDVEKVDNRIDQISGLLSRFNLLSEHYRVDIQRLKAIEESGSLFFYYETVENCPLCGSSVHEQHQSTACDGNIEDVVMAATAEIEKITQLSLELQDTIADLHQELEELSIQKLNFESELPNIKNKIEDISSPLRDIQNSYSEISQQTRQIERQLYLFERIESLEEKIREVKASTERLKTEIKSQKSTNSNQLSETSIYDEFAQKVQSLLKSWEYPEHGRVHFDQKSRDIVINGKPRGSNGKGYRAITHAAMTIALLEYCQEKDLSHPGFVILDSPLLGYSAPDGDDDSLKGSNLKEKFYEYLAIHHAQNQIIIFENENPPPENLVGVSQIHFTRNQSQGRYGFFPMEN